MFKGVQWFVNRLVERVIPVVGTLFSSAVETLHALGQAEQQSQLEEAARRYEADGKPEIAATLRSRAADITSDNPASQALRICENVAGDEQRLLPPTQEPSGSDLAQLPNLNSKPAKSRRKKSSSSQSASCDA
jgi:hypothetical protein